MDKKARNKIFTAIITPMKVDGAVDFDSFEKLLHFQHRNGIRNIVICGSTGERSLLSIKEYEDIVSFASRFESKFNIIFGAGLISVKDALSHIDICMKFGFSKFLITPSFYIKPNQNAIIDYYNKILSHDNNVEIVLYNIKSRTGVSIENETILTLLNNKQVIGIKDSSGNLELINFLQNQGVSKGKDILCGDDGLFNEYITKGYNGLVSVVSNAYPRTSVSLDINDSSVMKFWAKASDIFFIDSNPLVVKYILFKMGIIENKNANSVFGEIDDTKIRIIDDFLKKNA